MEFKEKLVLITGVGTRIGQQLAIFLALTGMRVAGHYHQSEQGALQTLKEIGGIVAGHQLYQADLRDWQQTQNLIPRINQQQGKISVLINNAADFYPTPLGQVSQQDWDHFFNLNARAPFILSQAVKEDMLSLGQGRIINMVDVASERPWPNYLPYCASKAALVSLTKGLAKTLAPKILVNGIAPGTVMSPKENTDIDDTQSIQQSLLRRLGSPQDIVQAVEFLLKSDFVTGVILPVDGGRMIA